MEEYEVSSVVRGFHVYQRSWSPSLEEQLEYPLYFSLVDTLRAGLLTSSCFTSGFTLSLADRMSFGDRVVEALTVTSGSLKLSTLSFFEKYLSIDSRSRRTLDPCAIYDDIMVS